MVCVWSKKLCSVAHIVVTRRKCVYGIMISMNAIFSWSILAGKHVAITAEGGILMLDRMCVFR